MSSWRGSGAPALLRHGTVAPHLLLDGSDTGIISAARRPSAPMGSSSGSVPRGAASRRWRHAWGASPTGFGTSSVAITPEDPMGSPTSGGTAGGIHPGGTHRRGIPNVRRSGNHRTMANWRRGPESRPGWPLTLGRPTRREPSLRRPGRAGGGTCSTLPDAAGDPALGQAAHAVPLVAPGAPSPESPMITRIPYHAL